MENHIDWKQQISVLEDYCNGKSWVIEYRRAQKVKSDFAAITDKKIVIKKDRRPEITFYIMLHEIGHMMLCQNRNMYNERYNAVYDNFSRASMTHKIKLVEEELDAWKIGYKLAKRLKLYVNQRKFESVKVRCVSTYMSWAVEKKIKKENKQHDDRNNNGDSKIIRSHE